jgi:cyclophilin family peptidyl-prolyl cis-trans isomerase
MKLRLAPVLLLAALAGCGGGTQTSDIPSSGGSSGATTSSTTAAAATTAAPAGCKAVKAPKPKPDGSLKRPSSKLDAAKTWTATVTTNCGTFAFQLDVKRAPNASASIAYLASKKFFNGTVFHRIVPGFVIQGGDPTGTGSGGPTYVYAEEIPKGTKYPRGTIAMANAGPGTTGSQFFLCFTNADLPADYTPVGTVDAAGLAVLDKIAKAGNDGSFDPSPGGGKPKIPVQISSISVAS